MWYAVWGNGRTGVESGILGIFSTPDEANDAVSEFLTDQDDNQAVGAWVRRGDHYV